MSVALFCTYVCYINFRVEFLPVNWHKPLHEETTGTDERLRPLTLKSIPKLRNFVNDTLLDILFYTSPIYCQSILDTVVSEINRLYTLFCERNEDFKGKVSIMGHSLGSLISFDLLSHQKDSCNQEQEVSNQPEHKVVEKPASKAYSAELSLEQLFAQLDISDYAETFTKEGIDMDALLLCNDDDLKEGGLPLGMHSSTLFRFRLADTRSYSCKIRGKSFAFSFFQSFLLVLFSLHSWI